MLGFWIGGVPFGAGSAPDPAEAPLSLHAHAHNDYQHRYPLLEALSHGFVSIEVDIHLVDGDLLVAHDLEDVVAEKTLQALYLDPLQRLVRKNQGAVYPDGSGIFLLIDVKSHSRETWEALREKLLEYREILTVYREGRVVAGPVTVVISGNRDWEAMLEDSLCPALYDGRIEDLSLNPSSPLIPMVSAGWGDEFSWDGIGVIPEVVLEKVERIIEQAHQQGRKVRFWATDVPSSRQQEYIWETLLKAGVDIINTDKLVEFEYFAGSTRVREEFGLGKDNERH